MLLAFTRLREINSQLIPISLGELLAKAAFASVERHGL